MLDKMLEGFDSALVSNRVNVDIDENPDEAMKFKVRGVPTMILVDDEGKETKRLVGSVTQQKLAEFIA